MLELMVVIVLISMLLGMVSLASGPSPARQARQHAQTFSHQVQQLREQAVLQGQEFGVRVSLESYQAVRLDTQGWRAAAEPHRLPDKLTLGLELEGRAVQLDDAQGTPQLLILSSDEISPFRLHIRVAGQSVSRVSSDGIGQPLIDE